MTLEQRALGTPDLMVTTIGLGCNNFGRSGSATATQEGTTAVLNEARELGVTLLDTADMYGGNGLSETLMGNALRGHRDRFVLATKFGHQEITMDGLPDAPKGSREYIRAAVEGSLRRLQTDYLDLYQLHTPDPTTPIAETLEALGELVLEGRVRFIGSSQFSADQVREADDTSAANNTVRFVSTQNEYNLLKREAEDELLPVARDLGIGFLPFFPLANGLLTGKFTREVRPSDTRIMRQRPEVADQAPWEAIERYARFCDERGITMLEATMGWLLSEPALSSVIAGATRPEQLRANVAASVAWRPTAEDRALLDGLFPRVAE
jgi:aryl-alcohol dehydrogenase-like predicted oxidoreductase